MKLEKVELHRVYKHGTSQTKGLELVLSFSNGWNVSDVFEMKRPAENIVSTLHNLVNRIHEGIREEAQRKGERPACSCENFQAAMSSGYVLRNYQNDFILLGQCAITHCPWCGAAL